MRHFPPRTLFGQILLALFVGLIAAQAIGFWLMLDERARFGERLLGAFAAQRLAGVISVIDQASPAERERIVRALNVPPTRLALGEDWQAPPEAAGKEGGAFAGFIMQALWPPPPPDQDLDEAQNFIARVVQELDRPVRIQILALQRAQFRRPGTDQAQASSTASAATVEAVRPRPSGGRPVLFVIGQARLSDGSVLTFRHGMPQQGIDWPKRLAGSLAILALSVGLLAAWAVRRLTRPLATLADAASGLARNLDQAPLVEDGPLEVSRAAQAFNAMQRELKAYLATRAQALAAVSHDLRLPLTRMRLRIDRLGDENLKAGIEADLAEMDQMIGNTLEFLRAGSPAEHAVALDLDALIESTAEDMAAVGAELRITGHARAPLVARPLALRRCLANLIDNARRYGAPPIELTIVDDGDKLTVRIEDRGPGIAEHDLQRVFEPYVRLETSRARHTGGSGLGLAIARAIARSHGGELSLRARAGGGLCAELVLPRTVGSGPQQTVT